MRLDENLFTLYSQGYRITTTLLILEENDVSRTVIGIFEGTRSIKGSMDSMIRFGF